MEAARRAGRDLEVHDHALAGDSLMARQCGLADYTLRPSGAPLESDATAIITNEHTAELLMRGDRAASSANALNWREARTQLAPSVREGLEPLRLAFWR